MAVNTVIDGNFLVIDDGSAHPERWSSAWISIRFDDDYVYLTNDVLPAIEANNNPYQIALADFQYNGVAAITETAIFTALKSLIGSSS